MKMVRASSQAFTLIEIMVVVGIIGILMAMGVPSIIKAIRREGMRKATNDIVEVCRNARARAILSGTQTEVIFHPLELRLEVSGGGGGNQRPNPDNDNGEAPKRSTAPPDGSGLSARIPNEIQIEMLDINLLEYRESDVARVRFYPNGTSDELTLILHDPDKNEWRKIWLEVTTGLADWSTKIQ